MDVGSQHDTRCQINDQVKASVPHPTIHLWDILTVNGAAAGADVKVLVFFLWDFAIPCTTSSFASFGLSVLQNAGFPFLHFLTDVTLH